MSDPHASQRILTASPPPEQAAATLLLMHGRGGTAADMLSLYAEIGLPTVAAFVPQAAGKNVVP